MDRNHLNNYSDIESTIEACHIATLEWQKEFINTGELNQHDDTVTYLFRELKIMLIPIKDSDYFSELILKYQMGDDSTPTTDNELSELVYCNIMLGFLLSIG